MRLLAQSTILFKDLVGEGKGADRRRKGSVSGCSSLLRCLA